MTFLHSFWCFTFQLFRYYFCSISSIYFSDLTRPFLPCLTSLSLSYILTVSADPLGLSRYTLHLVLCFLYFYFYFYRAYSSFSPILLCECPHSSILFPLSLTKCTRMKKKNRRNSSMFNSVSERNINLLLAEKRDKETHAKLEREREREREMLRVSDDFFPFYSLARIKHR